MCAYVFICIVGLWSIVHTYLRCISTFAFILAANPVCTTYMKSDGLIGSNTCTVENEKVQFSCSVAFYGQPPKMKWSSVENYDHLTNFSCKENDRQLICNLTMKAEQKLNGSSYVCHTTRATSGHYQCTTEALQIIGE